MGELIVVLDTDDMAEFPIKVNKQTGKRYRYCQYKIVMVLDHPRLHCEFVFPREGVFREHREQRGYGTNPIRKTAVLNCAASFEVANTRGQTPPIQTNGPGGQRQMAARGETSNAQRQASNGPNTRRNRDIESSKEESNGDPVRHSTRSKQATLQKDAMDGDLNHGKKRARSPETVGASPGTPIRQGQGSLPRIPEQAVSTRQELVLWRQGKVVYRGPITPTKSYMRDLRLQHAGKRQKT